MQESSLSSLSVGRVCEGLCKERVARANAVTAFTASGVMNLDSGDALLAHGGAIFLGRNVTPVDDSDLDSTD